MLKRRTAAYCVLLAMFIFAGAVFGSVGKAQARYNSMIFFSTVVEAEKTEISSDILAKENEAGVILMLGDVPEAKTFEFSLSASGGTAEETISWEYPKDYVVIYAELSQKAAAPETETAEAAEAAEAEETLTEINSGDKIKIAEGTETKVRMEVVPIENAVTTKAEKIVVNVGGLSGTVIFEIPPDEEENVSGGESDKVQTGTGETESGGGETGGSVGGTSGTVEAPAGKIDILPNFEPAGMLPMKVDIPVGAHYVRIGTYEGEKLAPLPAGTRISLNEGKDFYIIPENAVPEFPISNITCSENKYSILLDFGRAEITPAEAVAFGVEAFSESGKIAVLKGESLPDISGAGISKIETGVEELEIGEGEEEIIPEEPEYYVLSEGGTIRISFPEEWKNFAKSGYSIQMLRTAENETVGYSNVDILVNSLWAEYAEEEGNADLLIKVGEILPPAGKYQAILQWEFNGICFYKKQITFFINYSTDIYSTFESQGVAGK